MSHAYKRVAPRRISFVEAVTKYGDAWSLAIPLFEVGGEDRTQDSREFHRICSMERGRLARVDVPALDLDAYPPMEVGEHGYGYCAHRHDYDGAPDSHHPLGIGRTKFEAIADLLEQEELRQIAGGMVIA